VNDPGRDHCCPPTGGGIKETFHDLGGTSLRDRRHLYRLVDAAYEKRSVALSSNLHPAAFDELMPKTLATAIVDRLLHDAHVCQTSGESVRLSQALDGQGVSPLA